MSHTNSSHEFLRDSTFILKLESSLVLEVTLKVKQNAIFARLKPAAFLMQGTFNAFLSEFISSTQVQTEQIFAHIITWLLISD